MHVSYPYFRSPVKRPLIHWPLSSFHSTLVPDDDTLRDPRQKLQVTHLFSHDDGVMCDIDFSLSTQITLFVYPIRQRLLQTEVLVEFTCKVSAVSSRMIIGQNDQL